MQIMVEQVVFDHVSDNNVNNVHILGLRFYNNI